MVIFEDLHWIDDETQSFLNRFVPVGYLKRDRSLEIEPVEAETVRVIFERYLQLKSVRLLKEDLDSRGLVSKTRIGKNGLKMGGKAYSRGKLYKMLSNPICVGEIRHLETRHTGLHAPIIDRDRWEKTQQTLALHAVRRSGETAKTTVSPLAGKLIDESHQALTPTHAVKKGLRHRYYVSRSLLCQGTETNVGGGWRLPAREIEHSVAAAAATLLEDQSLLLAAIHENGIEADRIVSILEEAARWALKPRSSAQTDAIALLIDRVELKESGLKLSLLRRGYSRP